MSAIQFTTDQIIFRLKNKSRYQTWIERIILSHQKFPSKVDFIFTNDTFLSSMNKQYLNQTYSTDIITFNYNSGHYISGDIFISIDRIKENASIYNIDFDKELERVMIHGILHLLGFNDKSEREKKLMTKKENEALEILNNI